MPDHSGIWPATSAAMLLRKPVKFSVRLDHFDIQSRGFETSRDLVGIAYHLVSNSQLLMLQHWGCEKFRSFRRKLSNPHCYHIEDPRYLCLTQRSLVTPYRFGSTFAQLLACCLTAPSNYLIRYWQIISETQRHSSEGNFTKETPAISHKNELEITYHWFNFKLPGPRLNIRKDVFS